MHRGQSTVLHLRAPLRVYTMYIPCLIHRSPPFIRLSHCPHDRLPLNRITRQKTIHRIECTSCTASGKRNSGEVVEFNGKGSMIITRAEAIFSHSSPSVSMPYPFYRRVRVALASPFDISRHRVTATQVGSNFQGIGRSFSGMKFPCEDPIEITRQYSNTKHI